MNAHRLNIPKRQDGAALVVGLILMASAETIAIQKAFSTDALRALLTAVIASVLTQVVFILILIAVA